MRIIINFTLLVTAAIVVLISAGYIYYGHNLPDVNEYIDSRSEKIVQINYSNGNQITRYEDKNKKNLQFYQLPSHLVNAVLAIEDQKFFSHNGFDIHGIKRAFQVNHKNGKIVQGGSTITQQLAKMLFLTPEKSLKRKIKELILAFRLESSLTKEQILTLYLNNAYFGSGKYGVRSAARYYFDKDISMINIEESARLASLLKAPSILSNKNNKDKADQRVQLVLKRMLNSGFIDNDYQDSITSNVNHKKERLQKLFFTDYVYNNYSKFIKLGKLKSRKIIINTTLDQRLQKIIEDEYAKIAKKYTDIKGVNFSAIVANKKGEVEALLGSADYNRQEKSDFAYKKTQIGDLYSIMILTSAFENGFTPYDLVRSRKEGNLKTILQAYQDDERGICEQINEEIKYSDITKLFTVINGNIKENKMKEIINGSHKASIPEVLKFFITIINNGNSHKIKFINDIQDHSLNTLYSAGSKFIKAISNRAVSYSKSLMEVKSKKIFPNLNVKTFVASSSSQDSFWIIGSDGDKVVTINIDKSYLVDEEIIAKTLLKNIIKKINY